MRTRNPVALLVVGCGALLALALVVASSLRASGDTTTPSAGTTVPAATTAAAGAGATAARITAPTGMASVRVSALPPEARRTLTRIDGDGPFPYAQDGAVFQNRERILPAKGSGYYREYTVETPGSDDRGARRIVVGETGERYYTDDHYDSFRLVVP